MLFFSLQLALAGISIVILRKGGSTSVNWFMTWNKITLPVNDERLSFKTRWWWDIDPYLFWSILLLLLLGIVMVFSASMTTALYAYGDVFYFLKRHLLGILLGFLFLTIFFFVSLDAAEYKPLLLLATLFFDFGFCTCCRRVGEILR